MLDLDGDWLCVTALMRNAVALYRRSTDGWTLVQTIESPTDPGDAATGPGFGRSIDLDGDTLVVGALRAGGAAPDVGAVFVYAREGDVWRLAQRLADPGGSTLDMYGHWVAHDEGRIAVGAFRKDAAGAAAAGAVLLYRRDGDAYERAFELAAPSDPPPSFTAYTLDYHAGHLAVSAGTAGAGPVAPHCFTAEFR